MGDNQKKNGDAYLSGYPVYKIRLYSKRLKSGKCQVKFYWWNGCQIQMYGYMLTEGSSTVTEVVQKIKRVISKNKETDWYYHKHLYRIGVPQDYLGSSIIFRGKNRKKAC